MAEAPTPKPTQYFHGSSVLVFEMHRFKLCETRNFGEDVVGIRNTRPTPGNSG